MQDRDLFALALGLSAFRTTRNLAIIIYLIAGKLDFQLTHL